MSMTYGDKSVTTLRSLITVVEHELAATAPPEALRVAWTQIKDLLALGPAPELRECPSCGEIGMRAASRCMRCWSSLAPLPPTGGAVDV